jgi:hypothetical protein
MKEYEKLAREASNIDYFKDTYDMSQIPGCLSFIDGYKEGFLKAREMAFEEMYETEGGGTWRSLLALGEKEV